MREWIILQHLAETTVLMLLELRQHLIVAMLSRTLCDDQIFRGGQVVYKIGTPNSGLLEC